MSANIFTREGVEIRRLKSGRCVLEDEWQQYVRINEVRSSVCPYVSRLTIYQVLRVPYMLENEPFDKLLVPHRPLPKANHYPPILSFGFAIPNHVTEFLRAARKYSLGDPEKLSTNTSLLRILVTSHLNERCGLPPGQGVVYAPIHSKQSDLVLEITTNYRMQIPEEKLDDALRGIREVFSLSDDAQPKWYLEPGIDEKDPDEYHLSSESFTPTTV